MIAALAGIGVSIAVRRTVVVFVSAVALLLSISVFAFLGIQSSERLASVRAHHGTLRAATVNLEARDIAADWAILMTFINVGLAIAAISHWRRSRANRS